MKGKNIFLNYKLYYSNGEKKRPRWILFDVFGSRIDAEKAGEHLKERYGWLIRIEKRETVEVFK